MILDILILLGAFLGCFANIVVKWGVAKGELKKLGNYVIAAILSFAVYGLYAYLKISGFLPSFPQGALFGFAVFLGFALEEIARDFVSLLKKK